MTSGIALTALLVVMIGDSAGFLPCLDGVLAARRRFVLAVCCHHCTPCHGPFAVPLASERATADRHYTQPTHGTNGAPSKSDSLATKGEG